MATLNPASMTFASGTFTNPPEFVERSPRRCTSADLHPELEVYDFGHVVALPGAGGAGADPRAASVQLRDGSARRDAGRPRPAAAAALDAARRARSGRRSGSAAAQLPLSFAALALGGNIRVGFEDNVYFERGRLAESNAQFVRRAVELVRTWPGARSRRRPTSRAPRSVRMTGAHRPAPDDLAVREDLLAAQVGGHDAPLEHPALERAPPRLRPDRAGLDRPLARRVDEHEVGVEPRRRSPLAAASP